MAGYYGYSKSNNAVDAEQNGIHPLTTAVKILASAAGITQKKARAIFNSVGACEWHHTSKYYNKTDYYDVQGAAYCLLCEPLIQAVADGKETDKYLEEHILNVEYETFNRCDR